MRGDQLAGFGGRARPLRTVERETGSVGDHVVGGEHEQTGRSSPKAVAWRAPPLGSPEPWLRADRLQQDLAAGSTPICRFCSADDESGDPRCRISNGAPSILAKPFRAACFGSAQQVSSPRPARGKYCLGLGGA